MSTGKLSAGFAASTTAEQIVGYFVASSATRIVAMSIV